MALMGKWGYQQHITQSASGKGLPDEQIGWFEFPLVEGGKGKPTDTLGGVNGWVVTKDAPPEAVEFLRFFINAERQREMGRRGTVQHLEENVAAAALRLSSTEMRTLAA